LNKRINECFALKGEKEIFSLTANQQASQPIIDQTINPPTQPSTDLAARWSAVYHRERKEKKN
jgi:hypothetical protein